MGSTVKTEHLKDYIKLFDDNILVLNEKEKNILLTICEWFDDSSSEVVKELSTKINQLQNLSNAMSAFPSIYEKSTLAGELRTETTLIEKMCETSPDIRLLTFPTRSILGKSFLVAKFHLFTAVLKIAENYLLPNEELEKIRNATRNIMFTIMAEDVYIAILDSPEVSKSIKMRISKSITALWEYRFDAGTEKFADVLSKVWRARDKIAPVFGTMLGTSELFLLSMELDEMWQKFMIAKMHISDIGMALEEFLFGISYENICFLRKELRRKGIHSIGRQDVIRLLGKNQNLEKTDPRLFYSSYSERRNNATARKRMNIEGPKHTLEDHYVNFLFETIPESEPDPM